MRVSLLITFLAGLAIGTFFNFTLAKLARIPVTFTRVYEHDSLRDCTPRLHTEVERGSNLWLKRNEKVRLLTRGKMTTPKFQHPYQNTTGLRFIGGQRQLNCDSASSQTVLSFLLQAQKNASWFLYPAQGTLLGFARSGAPMPEDDDIDIYVDSATMLFLLAMEPILWEKFNWTMRTNGGNEWSVDFAQLYPGCGKALNPKIDKLPRAIDVYLLERDSKGGMIQTFVFKRNFHESLFQPGRVISWDGITVTLPNGTEKILFCDYDDWRTPRNSKPRFMRLTVTHDGKCCSEENKMEKSCPK